MKRYLLIRHGMTRGNRERRYIGCRSDEPLCREGISALRALAWPKADAVFASPMRRCLQTAALLYPAQKMVVVPGLRECDFGAFEGLSHAQLDGRADYQAFIDSGGNSPFPGGESRASFSARCVRAFEGVTRALPEGTYAFVVHGGTIMAIMERYARPRGSYFDFRAPNGGGYCLDDAGRYSVFVP